jgi:hypothetical protein
VSLNFREKIFLAKIAKVAKDRYNKPKLFLRRVLGVLCERLWLVAALSSAAALPPSVVVPGRGRFAVPRLIDPQGPAAQFLAVKIGNHLVGIVHLHEPETARAVSFAVGYYFGGTDAPEFFKMLLELGFGRVMGKVAYKDFFYQEFLLRIVDLISQGAALAAPPFSDAWRQKTLVLKQ